jgi:hypothetical protein
MATIEPDDVDTINPEEVEVDLDENEIWRNLIVVMTLKKTIMRRMEIWNLPRRKRMMI